MTGITSDRGSGVGSLTACDQLRVWKYPSLSWQERNIAFIFPPDVSTKAKGKSHLRLSTGGSACPRGRSHVCRLMVHLLCRQVVSVSDRAGQLLLQPAHEPRRKRRLAPAAFARLRSVLFLVNLPFGANRFWVARSVFRNFSYLK